MDKPSKKKRYLAPVAGCPLPRIALNLRLPAAGHAAGWQLPVSLPNPTHPQSQSREPRRATDAPAHATARNPRR